MSHDSNGRIWSPVNLEEVYNVLGVTPTGMPDVGYICSNAHGRINKWSKIKPIRYADRKDALQESEFKGPWADNNQGIYYGLEASTEAGRLIQLHDATWNYLAPRPGEDWCRLTDFDGYDHQAKATLNGRFWNTGPVNYNIERSLQAEIYYDYQGTNTTGVDINEMLPVNVAEDIGDYYPGILVGNYARALYPFLLNESVDVGDYSYSPLRGTSGQWYQSWFADLDGHPSLSTSGAMDGVDLKCTVFLIRKLWQEGIFDMRQQWIDVASTINAYNAFSVPGAIAQMLTFEYYYQYTRVNVVGVALSTGSTAWPNANAGFTLGLEYPDGLPDERAHYRVTVSSPGVGSKDFYVNPTGAQLAAVSFTWRDIGLLPNPGSSVPGSVSGSVSYIDSDGTPHGVSHFSLSTN